jgi:hypothetical protein
MINCIDSTLIKVTLNESTLSISVLPKYTSLLMKSEIDQSGK